MALTPKQESFAQAVASGKTQADAYRSAYDASRMKQETIASKASILMADGNIRARVDELRKELSDKGLWSREDSVKALKSVTINPDNQTALISAVKELNAMHGYNAPVKVDVDSRVVLTLSNSDASL